ncbi:MAG: catalase [Rhodoferax sp.]|nr:catalase [Rhodoferax sp.]
MAKKLTPSIQWQEHVAPDEAERFASYGKQFAAIQARKSKKYGNGRALHRKQITAAKGSLEVLTDLPDFARHGLFAKPGTFETWVRLSNGGMDRAPDRMPDIRGFALHVLGVKGDSALGNGPAVSQDFALINQEVFGFTSSAEFVEFVVAASKGMGSLFRHLVKRYGVVRGPLRLVAMVKTMGKPFGGFATEPVYSAAPIACGPYAVRVRLLPAAGNGPATPGAKRDWGADFNAKLREKSLQWDLQLQPFVDEDRTPIEDASVNWPTPYTTVARLTLPRQDGDSAKGQAFAKQAEAAIFDPWQALADHRPLGDVMRARKVVYFESQKARGA